MKYKNKKIFILSLSIMTALSSVVGVNALEIKMSSNLEKQTINRTVAPDLETLTMVQAFPDANFRAYLCTTLSIADETALITSGTKSQIEFMRSLDVSQKSIEDLSGINYFVRLETLMCYQNKLKSLDISKNLNLYEFDCSDNKLESLDISKNINLSFLYCSDNELESLDFSKNIELFYLDCRNNNLKSLDVSKNKKLFCIYCNNNNLKSLDVSENIALETFFCNSNELESLDVSKNIKLSILDCSSNELKSLDVSENIALETLRCTDNMLKTLDTSKNVNLISLDWSNQRQPKKPSGGGSNTPAPIVTKLDSLVGSDRYNTSIKISKQGWDNADNVVLINSSSISDALSATPFAKAKNAPILLTQNNSLNQLTENEISRLGAKNIYIIGGFNSVDVNIEKYLKDKNLNIVRISGNDRYDTSIKLAKELNKENKLSKLVLVNGEKGLADAVSMGAISAREEMPILLTNENDDMKAIEELIDNKDISKTYVVGGDSLFNKDIEDKLPSVTKIAGEDRTETNSKVIDYFYDNNVLDNLYIAKNGENREDDLVDALSVGVLAGKTESPVILVGDGIRDVQESLINKKEFRNITQIGGNGNEKAFSEIENLVK
ncbi:cell wall-binding repeat-containing protein [Clostridioides sp. GD02377]|uniref:cell wall-binding repeat-containing protein n=1 Tax=unclassified Clostridioides TaxID=2635829 RepID=UPI00389E6B32